ncbi:TonB-dependent receptor [Aurantiacibacter zhengii]|uniref:TonB-dependent receptor n=1 Tax=Aurantiacibacter zhengii TaxID=2307003 RepID=A0A418NT19_9SPHN|nr:TonB-dependent receptor [Aurantiacibacter zhengii]RIV86790.1 TonB-dependent receptor [Aurantiacibacter zhengii]
MIRKSALLLASVVIPSHALAQEAPQQPSSAEVEVSGDREEPANDDFHGAIYVTASGVDRLDVVAGTSVLSGMALQRESSGQVGDILANLPGVEASGFSPGASRPILRGFGGDRVRVLIDGIGTIDASGASDDHAVAVDPLIAERIEVLRGPAVLLYGSQAIGGAVNVITKRIPPGVPDEAFHADLLGGVDSATGLWEGGISLDTKVTDNIVFHVDGSYRNTDDIEIPGFAASDDLRADLLADAAEEEEEGELEEAEEFRDAANISGIVPNTYTETWSAGTGIAFFSGESNFGVSFDYYDTEYGVPGAPGVGHHHHGEEEHGEEDHDHDDEHGEEEGEEAVSIGLRRYRADFRANIDLGDGFFDSVQSRVGFSDYTHTEFEGAEVGTVFEVKGVEGRVELAQSRRGGWGGATGLQFSAQDFVATGAEAYIPPNNVESIALFTLQEFYFGPFELEAGARYENTEIEASTLGIQRDFDTVSASLGGGYTLFDDFRAGLNVSRTERAPTAAELFAEGPHIATQQFEIGNPALDIERSWGAEGYVRGEIGEVKVNASVYRNWFDDFIYLAGTGEEEDELPVFAFLQQDADQWGAEAQVTFPLIEGRDFSLLGDVRGAYTRVELDDGTNAPRVPPLSLYGALEGRWEHFDLRGEVEWYDSQTDVAPFETRTDGFTMVNASLGWHPFEGRENLTIIAQVDNIFDAEGRRHTSFTKDFVPMTGRNFKLTARASF